MALNLALVTADTTHVAATNTRDALTSLGHTVTLYAQGAVTATNLAAYDVILCPRVGVDQTTLAGYLRAYIDQDIPVLAGLPQATVPAPGPATLTGGIGQLLSMYTSEELGDGRGPSIYAPGPHPVLAGFTVPGDITVYSSTDFLSAVNQASAYVGTLVTQLTSADNKPTVLLIESGTLDLTGQAYGARCGFIGWLYGRNGYSADGKTLLDAILTWAVARPGVMAAATDPIVAAFVGDHAEPITGQLTTGLGSDQGALVGYLPVQGPMAAVSPSLTAAISASFPAIGPWTSLLAADQAVLAGYLATQGPINTTLSPLTTALLGQHLEPISGTAPLALIGASPAIKAFHDWAGGLNPALLQTIYTLTLTDPAGLLPELILPMSSFQATAQAEGLSSFLSCVVPAALPYAEAITARLNGELVVSKGFRFADGTVQTEEILRIPLGEIRLDEGPNRASATLSGYGVVAPGTPKTRTLTGIRYRNWANGLRRVRADVDLFLRPGDTALDGSEAFTVSYISYYVGPEGQFMEAAERAL